MVQSMASLTDEQNKKIEAAAGRFMQAVKWANLTEQQSQLVATAVQQYVAEMIEVGQCHQ